LSFKSIPDAILSPRSQSPPYEYIEGRDFHDTLKFPNFNAIQIISSAIEEMNSPTDEQAALIRITLEGRKMSYPDRYDQENHKAKMSLEQAVDLLSQ